MGWGSFGVAKERIVNDIVKIHVTEASFDVAKPRIIVTDVKMYVAKGSFMVANATFILAAAILLLMYCFFAFVQTSFCRTSYKLARAGGGLDHYYFWKNHSQIMLPTLLWAYSIASFKEYNVSEIKLEWSSNIT